MELSVHFCKQLELFILNTRKIDSARELETFVKKEFNTLVPYRMAMFGIGELSSGTFHTTITINVRSKHSSGKIDDSVLIYPMIKEWAKTYETVLIDGSNSRHPENYLMTVFNRFGVHNMLVCGIPDISRKQASVFCFGGIPEKKADRYLEVIDMVVASLHKVLIKTLERTGDGKQNVSASRKLTMREMQIISCLSMGLSDAEIASETRISINTVRCHLRNVASKLGVKNRVQILTKAISQGVIQI